MKQDLGEMSMMLGLTRVSIGDTVKLLLRTASKLIRDRLNEDQKWMEASSKIESLSWTLPDEFGRFCNVLGVAEESYDYYSPNDYYHDRIEDLVERGLLEYDEEEEWDEVPYEDPISLMERYVKENNLSWEKKRE